MLLNRRKKEGKELLMLPKPLPTSLPGPRRVDNACLDSGERQSPRRLAAEAASNFAIFRQADVAASVTGPENLSSLVRAGRKTSPWLLFMPPLAGSSELRVPIIVIMPVGGDQLFNGREREREEPTTNVMQHTSTAVSSGGLAWSTYTDLTCT